jgi:hypothetical protein
MSDDGKRSVLRSMFDSTRGELYVHLLGLEANQFGVMTHTFGGYEMGEASAVIVLQLDEGRYLMAFAKETIDLDKPLQDLSKLFTVDEIARKLSQPQQWPRSETIRELGAEHALPDEVIMDSSLRPYMFGPVYSLEDCYHLHAALFMDSVPGGDIDRDEALANLPNRTSLLRDLVIHTEWNRKLRLNVA